LIYSLIEYVLSSYSFFSSNSVLTTRLLQDSSRSLCFWSLHQSWSRIGEATMQSEVYEGTE